MPWELGTSFVRNHTKTLPWLDNSSFGSKTNWPERSILSHIFESTNQFIIIFELPGMMLLELPEYILLFNRDPRSRCIQRTWPQHII